MCGSCSPRSSRTARGEVIHRIRDLIQKAPPRLDLLEINGAIRQVIELTRAVAMKITVCVTAGLADGLPPIRGDRVQLQQVMLNLILNAIEARSGVSDRERSILISIGTAGAGDVLVTVRDSSPAEDGHDCARVRDCPYDQGDWPTHAAVDLPFDYRRTRRTHVGRVNEARGAVF